MTDERFCKGMVMPFLVGAVLGAADAMRARATVIKEALQNMVGTERTSWRTPGVWGEGEQGVA